RAPAVHPLSLHDALPITPQFQAAAFRSTLEAASDAVDDGTWGVLAELQQMARRQAADECVPGMDEPAIVNEALDFERRALCDVIDRKCTRLNSSHFVISY